MVVDRDSGTQIQAFPIHEKTFVAPSGGMTGFDTHKGKYTILHAVENGTLKVDFPKNNSVLIELPAGADVSIDIDALYISYDAICWVS